MDVFEWDENFEMGIATIDEQHFHLVKVTNDFGALIVNDAANPEDIAKIFAELVSYTQYHFEEEEKLMDFAGLAFEYVESHKSAHKGFLDEVTYMHQQMDISKPDAAIELFEFLMNWLVFHIMGFDMSLARQIVEIQKGTAPAEAFLAEERSVDKATGLLLKSLKNLFHQVSSRNRQLSQLNQTLESKVQERTQSLFEANKRLGELASTDVLTGLSNRRHALQLLQQMWGESSQKSIPLACMMIDADGFKQINDSYGHDAGDIVLCQLAKHLTYSVRTDDVVCRLGGDEFLVLCPNTDEGGALRVAQHIHANISALTVPVTGGAWLGSVSVGVAARNASMSEPENLIKVADLGVYAAKEAGKNCVKMVAK